MQIELCQLARESDFFSKEIEKAFQNISNSARFILGEETRNFESNFANYIGRKYAVGTKSGTSALHLGLLALGVGPEDEVITTPLSFIASSEAIIQTGAKPVFCDIKLLDGNINEEEIVSRISPKTKAILGVHLYGNPCNNKKIQDICSQYGLFYIEDASHAHGSQDEGKKLGSFGDIACFSFMPAKILGAYGDAGIVVTDREDIYKRIGELRNHGRTSKYIHSFVGFNERIDTIQAAILDIKLPKLDDFISIRRDIAKRYREEIPFCVSFDTKLMESLNFFAYSLKVRERDVFVKRLEQIGISTGLYYPIPLHLQPAFAFLGYTKGDFPNAEYFSETTVSLPIHHFLTTEEIDFIIQQVRPLSEYILL